MSRFRNEAHRQQRALLINYKFFRRRGVPRDIAIMEARKKHARLSGTVAVMQASSWIADPIRVAAIAALAAAEA